MKIVIWTQSAPKVEAIKEAIFKIPYFEGKDIEIIDIKVSSWISDMPTSIEENMIWAKNRALNSKKEISDADFYIWMEGWTSFFWEKSYLFWSKNLYRKTRTLTCFRICYLSWKCK